MRIDNHKEFAHTYIKTDAQGGLALKRLRIYLDTSVISHLDAPDALREQADTRKLWEDIRAGKYDVVVSDVVIDELEGCSEPKLSYLRSMLGGITYMDISRTPEAKRLCDLYFEVGGLPPKSRLDALHIAIATVNSCNIILSWNFKHIVNYRAMTAVEVVNIKEGYAPLRILSPTMLLESED